MKQLVQQLGIVLGLVSFGAGHSQGALSSSCIRSLSEAERLAWHSLISDGSDVESPLSLIRAEGLEDSDLIIVIEQARAQGRFSMRMLREGEVADRGERSDQVFIFQYRIRTLSDHVFTVVVPHDCDDAVYNYGFN